jgi:hypothetical protein
MVAKQRTATEHHKRVKLGEFSTSDLVFSIIELANASLLVAATARLSGMLSQLLCS